MEQQQSLALAPAHAFFSLALHIGIHSLEPPDSYPPVQSLLTEEVYDEHFLAFQSDRSPWRIFHDAEWDIVIPTATFPTISSIHLGAPAGFPLPDDTFFIDSPLTFTVGLQCPYCHVRADHTLHSGQHPLLFSFYGMMCPFCLKENIWPFLDPKSSFVPRAHHADIIQFPNINQN